MEVEQKHVQIVNVEQAQVAFAVETLKGEEGLMLTITMIEHYPWAVGDPIEGIQVDIPFSAARAVAVALLRPIYLEMPDTTKIATDDPQEYIAHLAELIYDISTSKHPDPIRNLLDIDKRYKQLHKKVGKARKQILKWKHRWQHTAKWARQNHRTVENQRKAIRALENKIESLQELIDSNYEYIDKLHAERKAMRALENKIEELEP